MKESRGEGREGDRPLLIGRKKRKVGALYMRLTTDLLEERYRERHFRLLVMRVHML